MKQIFAALIVLVFSGNFAIAEESVKKEEGAKKELSIQEQLAAAEKRLEESIKNPELLVEKQEFDVIYGEEKAPVTIVEYASLSCSHCKAFYENVFTGLKEKYVDTGKLKFVYRHYPLNLPALRAAMLVDCASDEKKKLFVNALFKAQGEWAYERDEKVFIEKLKTVGKIGGLSSESVDKCLTDKKQEDAILEDQLQAGKGLSVTHTPTIFINGVRYMGIKKLADMSKEIDKLLTDK